MRLVILASVLGLVCGMRLAGGSVAVGRSSVGISVRGSDVTFATGVPVARDLVLTVRHATHVHRGQPARYAPAALDVWVDTGGRRQRLPVTAFAFTSERLDLALLRVGPDADGRLLPADSIALLSGRRLALGAVLTGVHRPGGGPERGDPARVLLPFDATPEELDVLLAGLPHEALRRALRMSYRDAGVRSRHFSTRWGGQPTLGVSPFAAPGSSGAPLYDSRGHVVGILFAGDDPSSHVPAGWRRHEAVLPAAAIRAELMGTSVGHELGIR